MLCCTVYLPGFFSIPPVDRDESRFAQASRQMFESVALPEAERDEELHSGGLAVPMVGGKPRLNKPPLIYWLQAGSAALFTGGDPLKDAIWMYRVPSLLAGLVTVLATWRLGVSMFDPRAGWVAGALLAVAPVFVWEAHQARADMVMVACTTLAMWQLWQLWRAAANADTGGSRLGRWAAVVLLWVCVALGVLTKGPITPMVVVLTALTLAVLSRGRARSRSSSQGNRGIAPAGGWRWLWSLNPLLGLVIVAARALALVVRRCAAGGARPLLVDRVRRGVCARGECEGGALGASGVPPRAAGGVVLAGIAPDGVVGCAHGGSGFRAAGVSTPRRSQPRGRDPDAADGIARATTPTASLRARIRGLLPYLGHLRTSQPAEAFLLAWLVPTWIVFELVGTKLPHYTMPMYPAVALITARGLLVWIPSPIPHPERARLGAYIWFGVGAVLLLGLGFAWLMTPGGVLKWSAVLGLALAAYALVKAFRTIPMLEFRRTQAWSMLAVWPLLVTFLVAVAPGVFGLSRSAHRAAAELAGDRPVTWVGFQEDSVTWFARGRPSFTSPDDLTEWFGEHGDGVAIVSVTAEDSYLQHLMELRPSRFVFGVHYAKGRMEKMAIVERIRD
ncbi:MAG: phospholipid carrier-dependent glycosyltransferase [Planctomycetota bacterium]|nr:MAG: phospholipid carrier-dependent glycosyltransferase [Planctomycetota bacterium]